MSKPFRGASSKAGLDVALTLPAPVVERIEGAARERGETVACLRRAEPVSLVEGEGAAQASPEEIAFDMRTALAKTPARRGMDEFAIRTLATGSRTSDPGLPAVHAQGVRAAALDGLGRRGAASPRGRARSGPVGSW